MDPITLLEPPLETITVNDLLFQIMPDPDNLADNAAGDEVHIASLAVKRGKIGIVAAQGKRCAGDQLQTFDFCIAANVTRGKPHPRVRWNRDQPESPRISRASASGS